MADEAIDAMLQGDDQPPASQAQTDDQGTVDINTSPTPEEVEFNSLPGSTQERIKKLVKDKREALERLERAQESAYVPPAPTAYQTPAAQDAIRQLADYGVATDEKVDKKIDEKLNVLRWESEMARLESKYSGSQGEPQFVREEVEEYIKDHPQYSSYYPEDVFRYKMFNTEFQSNGTQANSPRSGQSSTLRPTKSNTGNEALTPEYIEKRLNEPDGQEWYEDNLEKINLTLKGMTQ